MQGTIYTMKFARTGEYSTCSTSEFRKPSKTVLALVSPGCTLAVTKITFLRNGLTWWVDSDLLAVIEIFGTGRPHIVVHSRLRSYTIAFRKILRLNPFFTSASKFYALNLGREFSLLSILNM